uniref:Transmembrane protein n=1 Tax=Glossina brevipalpis TaxID=37001 RepID=A0A1A9WN11_9MUSC
MIGFDATDDANAELLNKLKDLDVRVDSAKANKCFYLKNCWKSLKLRATLNHIGLLVGLSVYCGVGGVYVLYVLTTTRYGHWNDNVKIYDIVGSALVVEYARNSKQFEIVAYAKYCDS